MPFDRREAIPLEDDQAYYVVAASTVVGVRMLAGGSYVAVHLAGLPGPLQLSFDKPNDGKAAVRRLLAESRLSFGGNAPEWLNDD